MHIFTNNMIFGPIKCYMYTGDWQKLGLPHVHILLWLQNKIVPSRIDSIISTDIQDSDDPILHDVVKSTVIHNPCGNLNRNSRCMVY